MPKNDSGFEELFKRIREAPEEEAREVFGSMTQTLLRGAAISIMNRNLSHGVGSHAIRALTGTQR